MLQASMPRTAFCIGMVKLLYLSAIFCWNTFPLKHYVWGVLEQSNTVALKARMWNYMALYQI
jgi:hypothetical protein